MQHHVTIALPPGISITNARNALWAVEAAAREALNDDTLEAHLSDGLELAADERQVLAIALDLALEAGVAFGVIGDGAREAVQGMRDRLAPERPMLAVAVAEHSEGLTRQQECAADAMASEYGRSRVRPLADGAVVITGMTGDVERRFVCVERDGRERWRS